MFDAIKDVGLVCDGVTDDTAALRGFIAMHPGPLIIQWPECVCCIGNLVVNRPVKFIGAGTGTPFGASPFAYTTFRYPPNLPTGMGTHVLKLTGMIAGCEVDGISIDARGAEVGLWLNSVSQSRFPELAVVNATGWAMILDIMGDGSLTGSSSGGNFFGHLRLWGHNGLKIDAPGMVLDACSNYFGRVDILYNGAPGTRGLFLGYTDSNHFEMVNVGECSAGTEPGVTFADAWQNHISWLVCPRGTEWAPVKLPKSEWGNSISALATGEQKGAAIECGLSIIACNGQTWNVGQLATTAPPSKMPTKVPTVQIVTPPVFCATAARLHYDL